MENRAGHPNGAEGTKFRAPNGTPTEASSVALGRMAILGEMQPGRTGEEQANQRFKSRPRRMSDQEKIQIFEEARREGRTANLTPKQEEVFRLRGFYESEGPLVPIRQVHVALQGSVKSFQAVHEREKYGFKVLENGSQTKTSRMKPEEREFIENNPDLPATHIAAELGRNQMTIAKYKDEVGVPRRPIGRPRKHHREDPAEKKRRKAAKNDKIVHLYCNKELSSADVAVAVGLSIPTVIKRLRARGVTIRPPGPHRKTKRVMDIID